MTQVLQNSSSDPNEGKLGWIVAAGVEKKSPGTGKQAFQALSSYAAIYTIEGRAHFQNATGFEQDLNPGDLVLLFPGLQHRYIPERNQNWSEFWIVFEGPVFELWESLGILDRSKPCCHLEPVDYWFKRFDNVVIKQTLPREISSLAAVCRLQEVFSDALLATEKGKLSQDELQWSSKACSLLNSDIGGDLELTEIATELCMSYGGFRKRFTKLVGITPGRYRTERLIERACQLLQETNIGLKEIAIKLGFCDEFHFSRRFKQIIGRSPRAFRQNIP